MEEIKQILSHLCKSLKYFVFLETKSGSGRKKTHCS